MRNLASLCRSCSFCLLAISCSTTPPDSHDAIDRGDVRRSFHRSAGDYKACFERARKTKRGLYGKMVLGFYIDDEGFAVRPLIDRNKSSIPPYALFDKCVLDVLKTQQFKKPRYGKPVQVFHQLTFSDNTSSNRNNL